MLQVRPQCSLGQYAPPGYGPVPYYGQPPGYVDPLLDAGLTAAGAALATSDPGAPQTFQIVRRIIAAPPFFTFLPQTPGAPGAPVASTPHKLSEINPALSAVAWAKENQLLSAMLVLGVPVLAYFLGRSSRR